MMSVPWAGIREVLSRWWIARELLVLSLLMPFMLDQ